jgi:hypothetical protein
MPLSSFARNRSAASTSRRSFTSSHFQATEKVLNDDHFHAMMEIIGMRNPGGVDDDSRYQPVEPPREFDDPNLRHALLSDRGEFLAAAAQGVR